MFDTKNISARSYVRPIRLKCLQAGSKITLTPSRKIHSKTEMPYAVIDEYSQEYFQPKTGRKNRQPRPEKHYSL